MAEQLLSDQTESMALMTDQVLRVLTGMGLKRVDVALALRRDWKSIVPDGWANARPIVLIEGRLSVVAPSRMEMTVLRYGAPALMKAINARFGSDTVTNVKMTAPRHTDNEDERR